MVDQPDEFAEAAEALRAAGWAAWHQRISEVILGEVAARSECPRCGFDSLLEIPIWAVTPDGMEQTGVLVYCGRCEEKYNGG